MTTSSGAWWSGPARARSGELTNVNPVYNRERFDEAHDVIIKAWTTPGPFRWEGRHFDYRVVNPWMRPLRPTADLIPGVVSPESVQAADIPDVALLPPRDRRSTTL
jgi:alkanesulfonate monooxygenase SsuD/methylene tetrahydromethanopterin reductase-like flavin-dependent oxidoreductase (luciferase family)